MDKRASGNLSWAIFYTYRREIRKSFRNIYKLKIKKNLSTIILEELKGNEGVLDIGASNKNLGDKLKKNFPSLIYKTMDIDKTNIHDYYSLDEINEQFDVIVLSEVIEHLEFEKGIELLCRLKSFLKQKGKVIITTPNIHHPHRYLWDPDHKVPYRYDVLGGASLYAGFNVEKIYRIYNNQFLKRAIKLALSPVYRFLDIDFAKTIAVIACKKRDKE